MPPRQQPVSCGACQYFRRKCTPDCIFAPYFPHDNPDMFIKVHNTFKASNVKRMLSQINDPDQRRECVRSLAYEAEVRSQDPVNGCAGYISRLKQALANGERELASYINVGKNILLSQQMNYNRVQHQQMMMMGVHQPSSSSSNYIYGAAGTSLAPSSQTQLIRDQQQQPQQHDQVGVETTQQQYAAVLAATDHWRHQLVINQQQQQQQLNRSGQSSHDVMHMQASSDTEQQDPTAVPTAADGSGFTDATAS